MRFSLSSSPLPIAVQTVTAGQDTLVKWRLPGVGARSIDQRLPSQRSTTDPAAVQAFREAHDTASSSPLRKILRGFGAAMIDHRAPCERSISAFWLYSFAFSVNPTATQLLADVQDTARSAVTSTFLSRGVF